MPQGQGVSMSDVAGSTTFKLLGGIAIAILMISAAVFGFWYIANIARAGWKKEGLKTWRQMNQEERNVEERKLQRKADKCISQGNIWEPETQSCVVNDE